MSTQINISKPTSGTVAIVTDDYTASLLIDLLNIIEIDDTLSGYTGSPDELRAARHRLRDGLRSVTA